MLVNLSCHNIRQKTTAAVAAAADAAAAIGGAGGAGGWLSLLDEKKWHLYSATSLGVLQFEMNVLF